jgi:hypothetical protein
MANCPNCGSKHIQIKKETDVNWGRAIAGYALFGVVGAAVGAVTGEDRNANACLDCGTSWKAQDLYKLLGLIQDCTGVKLNLAKQSHRSFMNNFVSEIGSYLEEIPEIEKRADQLIINAEAEVKRRGNTVVDDNWWIGCLFFIVMIIVVLQIAFQIAIATSSLLNALIFLIVMCLSPFLFIAIYTILTEKIETICRDKFNLEFTFFENQRRASEQKARYKAFRQSKHKEENDKLIQDAKYEALIMKREAERNLNRKIKNFMERNPL